MAIVAASWMLATLVCLTAANAQDSDSVVTNPSTTTQVTGTWTGTDTEAGSSPGPMMLVLSQSGKTISGTFSLTSQNETPAGNVAGAISKNKLKLTFKATSGTQHDCSAKVMATLDPTAMPPTMSGTFQVIKKGKHCKGSGRFDLTQQ